MYVYLVGSMFPGCLPDNPPAAFDNERDAREYMKEEFAQQADSAAELGADSVASAFDGFVEAMEFHGDAAMGRGDSYWDGPDGMVYFVECVDVTAEEWRQLE